jgi:MYXO-CTERM domain-containing protein
VVGIDLGEGGGPGGSDGAAKAGLTSFLQAPPISTEGMEDVHLELWQHHAVSGTLRVLVDDQVVFTYQGDGSTWSGGWRYLPVSLGEAARDRKEGVVVRFEITAAGDNALGGWALDDFRLSGTEIPPPPPPPPPPPTEEPPPETPAPEEPVVTPSPEVPGAPADDPGPLDLHRNTIGGGCTCAVPAPASGGIWAFWVVFGLAAAQRRRR